MGAESISKPQLLFTCALLITLGALFSTPAQAAFVDTPAAKDLAIAMGIPESYIISVNLYSLGTEAAFPASYGVYSGSLGNYTPSEGTTFTVLSNGANSLIPGDNSENGAGTTMGNGGGVENGGNDIVTLHIRLNPPDTAQSFHFDFVFVSEEYPEYVGSAFNDFFVCEVDGHQIKYDTSTGKTIITSDYNVVTDQQGQTISINANFFTENSSQNTGTQMDGWTPVLTTCAPVNNKDQLDLYFTVADVGDAVLMSAVYLDNLQFHDHASAHVTVIKGTHKVLGENVEKRIEAFSYPNPYNPRTGDLTIKLTTEACDLLGAGNGIDRIEIFDVSGRRITYIPSNRGTSVTWNGRNSTGDLISPGTYIYTIKTNVGKSGKGKFTVIY